MKKNRTLELVLVSLVIVLMGFVSVPRLVENQKMARVRIIQENCFEILNIALTHPRLTEFRGKPIRLKYLKNYFPFYYKRWSSIYVFNQYLPENKKIEDYKSQYILTMFYEDIAKPNLLPDYAMVWAVINIQNAPPSVFTGGTPPSIDLSSIIEKDKSGNWYGDTHQPYFDVSNGLESYGVIFVDRYGARNEF